VGNGWGGKKGRKWYDFITRLRRAPAAEKGARPATAVDEKCQSVVTANVHKQRQNRRAKTHKKREEERKEKGEKNVGDGRRY